MGGITKPVKKAVKAVKSSVVPALLVGVGAGTTFGAAGLVLGFSGGAFATTLALSAGAAALAPTPKQPNLSGGGTGGAGAGRTLTARQSNSTRKLTYGTSRVGGTIVFMETTGDDKFLHLVIVISANEINNFAGFFFNDELLSLDGNGDIVAPTKFVGKGRIIGVTKGTSGNIPADLLATPSWTSSHKLTDQAYIYARLEYDPDAYSGGLPNITAEINGRKIYDTRTSTTAFSRNPAMVIRDYLLDAEYGLGATSAEIDDTSFNAAANICDEQVLKNFNDADLPFQITVGGSPYEPRYTLDGVVDTANTPRGNLEQMLTSCNGSLYYSNGKWHMNAGAYKTPTVTLDEDDLASGLQVTTKTSGRDSFNAVKGQFVSPNGNNYQVTDYPVVTSSTFVTEDNGETRFLNLDLPFTISSSMAQRIAKQVLYKNRQQIAINATFKMTAFQFEVGDTVMITNSRFGWSQKVFEVVSWRLNFSTDQVAVDCMLVETNSAVYDWNAEETEFTADDTTLPDPFTLPAPTVTTDENVVTINQQPVGIIEVTASSTNPQVNNFEAEYKESTLGRYITLGIASGGFFTIPNVKSDVTYDIRVRSIGAFTRSAYTDVQHTVSGKADDPSDVTNFSVNIVGQQADLSWTPVTDADLSHYIIRHSPLTSGAAFNDTRAVVKKVSRPANTAVVPAMTGTYFIKAVDKFGRASQNADSSVALVDAINGFNFVDNVVEHTAFSGTKTDVVAIDDKLQLDTSNLFDSVAGNFDDAAGLFDGGTGFIVSSGTYDFANYIDLTATYTGTVDATVKVSQISQHSGTPASGATDVDLLISTTTDDPAGSPTWTAYRPFIVGSYTARAMRFRAELSTTESDETPAIEELSAEVQLPTRTQSESDIQSGAGSKAVTFTTPFKSLLAVSISVGDMQSGDYYAITSKSATGFTIAFYDSGNSAVDRLFDYVATGF